MTHSLQVRSFAEVSLVRAGAVRGARLGRRERSEVLGSPASRAPARGESGPAGAVRRERSAGAVRRLGGGAVRGSGPRSARAVRHDGASGPRHDGASGPRCSARPASSAPARKVAAGARGTLGPSAGAVPVGGSGPRRERSSVLGGRGSGPRSRERSAVAGAVRSAVAGAVRGRGSGPVAGAVLAGAVRGARLDRPPARPLARSRQGRAARSERPNGGAPRTSLASEAAAPDRSRNSRSQDARRRRIRVDAAASRTRLGSDRWVGALGSTAASVA